MINIRKILLLLLCLMTASSIFSGTRFYIFSEKKTPCKEDIPSSFSSFLDQREGYGEQSEYECICRAINKDLEIFFERAVNGDDTSPNVWINIDSLTLKLKSFLKTVLNLGNLDRFVQYDPRKNIRDSLFRQILKLKEPDQKLESEYQKLDSEILNDHTHPFYLFPANYGYLSNNKLQSDLAKTINILSCYKKAGSKKVRIVYM